MLVLAIDSATILGVAVLLLLPLITSNTLVIVTGWAVYEFCLSLACLRRDGFLRFQYFCYGPVMQNSLHAFR